MLTQTGYSIGAIPTDRVCAHLETARVQNQRIFQVQRGVEFLAKEAGRQGWRRAVSLRQQRVCTGLGRGRRQLVQCKSSKSTRVSLHDDDLCVT